jgi:hypothetical protein
LVFHFTGITAGLGVAVRTHAEPACEKTLTIFASSLLLSEIYQEHHSTFLRQIVSIIVP